MESASPDGFVPFVKAKKREKKKLAAKESALEPAVEAGKDKNIMVGGEGTKSHIKITDVVGVAGGRGKEKGNGEAVERSQVLGKKVRPFCRWLSSRR